MKRRAKTMLWALAAGAAYFLALRAGTLLVADPDGIAAVWPASGVLLAVLLASGGRKWRAIGLFTLAGAAASTLVDGDPTPATAVAAAAGWAEGLLAAAILTRLTDQRPSLGRLRDVGALLVASAVSCAVGALAGSAALASEAGNALGSTWVAWWSADAVGMLAVAPIALALRDGTGTRPSPRAVAESLALLAAVVGVCLLVFGADPSIGGLRSALPATLVLPLLLVASVRLGALPASLGSLAVTLIAARLTIEEHGPFANAVASTADRLLGMRAFLAVAVGASMAAVALARERRRLPRVLHEEPELLIGEPVPVARQRPVPELTGTTFAAVSVIDENGQVSDWNSIAQGEAANPLIDTIVPALFVPPRARPWYETPLETLRRTGEVSETGERNELEAGGVSGCWVPIEQPLSSTQGEARPGLPGAVNDPDEVRALEEQVAGFEEERQRLDDNLQRARLQATEAELLRRASIAEHERRLDESEHARQQVEKLFEDAPIAMAVTDSSGQLVRVNAALSELTGAAPEQLATRTLEELAHPADRELVRTGIRPLLERGGRWQGEVHLLRASEQSVPVALGVTTLRERDHEPFLLVHAANQRDRRRAEKRIAFLAGHDDLTGLPDRGHLEGVLEAAHDGALAVVDIDGLGALNYELGRPAGDTLLSEAARALRGQVHGGVAVARIGGDAFGLVLQGAGETDAHSLGEDLLGAVRSLLTPDGRTVSASVGVVLFTGAEVLSAQELLLEAELALYDAKEAGRDRMVVRRATGNRRGRDGERGRTDPIRQGLDDDRFVLNAQPIVNLAGGVARYELLPGLVGDDGEMISAATFLCVAERFGLVQEIDRWVIGEAVKLLARARDAGRELQLEVNLSAPSVADARLPELIARELQAAKVTGSGLSLAIDEATAIENLEAVRVLAEESGCELVLDHFGSGLASFHYLQQLAVDYVKIDGSFIKDLPRNRAGRMVVKSVVEAAGRLGSRTIAEQVGDAATLAQLMSEGVDYVQGPFVGRPRPAQELEMSSAPPPDGTALSQSG